VINLAGLASEDARDWEASILGGLDDGLALWHRDARQIVRYWPRQFRCCFLLIIQEADGVGEPVLDGIGKTDHNYMTDLTGFHFKHNWIFYEADHHKVRFVHIVPSRRNRSSIRF
jgi:hypothetical protein